MYNRSVIFHELKPMSLDHNIGKKGEAKVEIPLAKEESPKIPEDEESSGSSSSFEEEHYDEPLVEPQEASTPELRRSTQERRKPNRYTPNKYSHSMLNVNCAYALLADTDEPRTIKEAIKMPNSNS